MSLASIWESYRVVFRHGGYRSYLAICTAIYAGLLAWLTGAAFVLQDIYLLSAFEFGFVFAIGSAGFLVGSNIAARIVTRLGIDKVIGIGAVLAAVGGACVLLSVMLGLKSSLTIVLPAAIYLCGLGMVLPQSIAGAMTPFPERAGAASSLFGFIQQTTAAASGAVVGLLLGYGAWPMAVAIALMGLTTLVLWIATRGVRKRNAYVHRD